MTQVLKMTSKRQVTFPVSVCQELSMKVGQEIYLEKRKVEGETAWVIRPHIRSENKWYGALRRYADEKQHDMEDIRASIGRKKNV